MIGFECDGTKAFYDYWQSLPRNGLVPESKDFLPEDIPELLPFITIYELVSEDFIRFRLAGTMIANRYGRDRTGQNYLDEVTPKRRKKASEAFWAVYNQPCGMRVIIDMKKKSGLALEVESLGLPMINSRDGYPLLYYTNYMLVDQSKAHHDIIKRDWLELIAVTKRDFIDIGAGIPDFKD